MENLVSCLHHLVKEVGEVVYGKGVFIEVGDEVIPQELYLFWHFFVDKVHIEDGWLNKYFFVDLWMLE